jgi:hypothetical protein
LQKLQVFVLELKENRPDLEKKLGFGHLPKKNICTKSQTSAMIDNRHPGEVAEWSKAADC